MPAPTRSGIIVAASQALALAPSQYPADLPLNQLTKSPEYHSFEHSAWSIGEDIRQAMFSNLKLRRDLDVQESLMQVVECINLRRGRQSFVMCLEFKAAQHLSKRLVPFLTDPDVQGHVVAALLKMQAPDHAEEVCALERSPHAWIRKLAKKYSNRYTQQLT